MHDALTAWQALRERLRARARELAEEVRAYPGPIARCDEQLPALIAERSRALEAAHLAEALERERATLAEPAWRARLAGLVVLLRPGDTPGAALEADLLEALRRVPASPSPPAE